jgi:hypothetical protein
MKIKYHHIITIWIHAGSRAQINNIIPLFPCDYDGIGLILYMQFNVRINYIIFKKIVYPLEFHSLKFEFQFLHK